MEGLFRGERHQYTPHPPHPPPPTHTHRPFQFLTVNVRLTRKSCWWGQSKSWGKCTFRIPSPSVFFFPGRRGVGGCGENVEGSVDLFEPSPWSVHRCDDDYDWDFTIVRRENKNSLPAPTCRVKWSCGFKARPGPLIGRLFWSKSTSPGVLDWSVSERVMIGGFLQLVLGRALTMDKNNNLGLTTITDRRMTTIREHVQRKVDTLQCKWYWFGFVRSFSYTDPHHIWGARTKPQQPLVRDWKMLNCLTF